MHERRCQKTQYAGDQDHIQRTDRSEQQSAQKEQLDISAAQGCAFPDPFEKHCQDKTQEADGRSRGNIRQGLGASQKNSPHTAGPDDAYAPQDNTGNDTPVGNDPGFDVADTDFEQYTKERPVPESQTERDLPREIRSQALPWIV